MHYRWSLVLPPPITTGAYISIFWSHFVVPALFNVRWEFLPDFADLRSLTLLNPVVASLLISVKMMGYSNGSRRYSSRYSRGRRSRRPMQRRRYSRSRYRMSGRGFAQRVQRVVDSELKFAAIGASLQPIVGNQSEIILSNIEQGTGATNRIGNWIRPITVHGNVTIEGTPGAVASTFGVRVGVACWKHDESLDPFQASDIMLSGAAPGGPFSVVQKGAFQVLWSRYVVVVNNDDNSKVIQQLRFKAGLGSLPKILYDGAINKKNHIFFFAVSDDTSGANPVTVEFDIMFRYTDS